MGGRGPGGGPAASGRGAVPEPQRVRRADAGMGASMADAGFDPNAMSKHLNQLLIVGALERQC